MPFDSLMVSVVVLEDEVSNSLVEFKPIFRRIEVNVFALDRSPEALNEGIVCGSSLAVHGDLDSVALHGAYPMLAGILRSLVGINNLWHTMLANGFMQHRRLILFV